MFGSSTSIKLRRYENLLSSDPGKNEPSLHCNISENVRVFSESRSHSKITDNQGTLADRCQLRAPRKGVKLERQALILFLQFPVFEDSLANGEIEIADR